MAVKAVEFEGRVAPTEQIAVPGEIARHIPAGSNVRVILLWEEGGQEDWQDFARERFAAAYAPEDSVYEELIDEPLGR